MEKLKPLFDQLFAQKVPDQVLKKSNYNVFERIAETRDLTTVLPIKEQLREMFGKKGKPYSETIGIHPDFKDLEEGESRNQYICSLFLDISGSTKLGLKFPLPTVKFYKNAILQSAIEIFQVFDGHIHRLQGDAVFAYFGHKGMKKSDAIINALNAASLMQAYNKYTLSEFFIENDLDPLKIRVGIDIGDEHQVLWSAYGLGQISEVTSTSIHTDLAAKLQGQAPRNQILVGENLYSYLDLPEEFLKVKTYTENGEKKEAKHILYDSNLKVYYGMRLFDWEMYLKSFAFLPKEQSAIYKSPEDFEIICQVAEESNNIIQYKSNSWILEKGVALGFKISFKKNLALLKPSSIKWTVINRGMEASEGEDTLIFEMEEYKDKNICAQYTAYNGHHYMECSFYDSQNKLMGKDRFGLYVNDETMLMKDIGIYEN